MPSLAPSTLDEVHSQLDALAMKTMELSQDLLTAQVNLERCTREGNLLLAKARYASLGAGATGATAIGAGQIPGASDDENAKEFRANVGVVGEECARDGADGDGCAGVRFRYLSLVDLAEEEDAGDKDSDDESVLSHRKTTASVKGSDAKSASMKKLNHDPLKWFGILVPQSLRQAQKSFSRALEYSVEAANARNELLGVENRRKFLIRTAEKLAKEEQE